MTQYFYTDALAAAWMEVHHGIKTENLKDGYFSAMQVLYYEASARRDGYVPSPHGERFHACAESVSLLEPQVGDMLSLPSWSDRARGFMNVTADWLANRRADADPDLVIIQRNGKAFHWPSECRSN